MSLYIEKYRPVTREEIVGNEQTLNDIFSLVKTGNVPHMIFEGPAGVGKTTTALVIARQLFGEFYKANFMELNASDERGIQVVRDTIKTFCKTAPLGTEFKILFLDEADNMTADAQQALRRIMEKYSDVTRFILSCNNPEKLIEPITSRCQVFRFCPLSEEDIVSRLKYICEQENISFADSEILNTVAKQADGDMRRAINKLQVLASYGGKIDKKLLIKIDRKDKIFQILHSLKSRRFLEARKLTRGLLSLGYTERDLIQLFHKVFISETQLNIPASVKGECIIELAETDYRLTQGVSYGLQLDALLLKLLKLLGEKS